MCTARRDAFRVDEQERLHPAQSYAVEKLMAEEAVASTPRTSASVRDRGC